MQVVIGVTRGTVLRPPYRNALETADVAVVEIGPESDRGRSALSGRRHVMDGLHGLMLTGGGDIDPTLYGAAYCHPATSVEPERDKMELALVEATLASGIPLLGICRGIQTLNVALGGTLWQDLPDERPSGIVHQESSDHRNRTRLLHTVDMVRGTRFADLVGEEALAVNSIHHQAIRVLAPRLRIAGMAPDGVIEAAECIDADFAIAVQWHPEELRSSHKRHARLFDAFRAACATFRGS